MTRFHLNFAKPQRLLYRDSLHAALIAGFRAAGAAEALIIGPAAAPWTFGVSGRSRPGGGMRVAGLTLSTASSDLGAVLERLDPQNIFWRSDNGDVVSGAGAVLRQEPMPIAPGQEDLAIGFASPFLISLRGGAKKSYARSLDGLDLSAAFSAGLTRRLGRPVAIEVAADRLSARTDGAAPLLVRVRKSGPRDLILPALSVNLTLRGRTADLRDAYLAGLGEKTRYGFGCPMALN